MDLNSKLRKLNKLLMIFVLLLLFNFESVIRFFFSYGLRTIRTLSLPARVRVHPFIQHPLCINHEQISLRNTTQKKEGIISIS